MDPDNKMYKFWSEWEATLDRSEKVQALSFFDRSSIILNSNVMKNAAATLFNSYLEDLYEYMIVKYNIEVKDSDN
jgi:hypothetical protein